MKTLLIIGGGIEQVPAYICAKKRGLKIVATDISPSAPALIYADHIIIASTKDPDTTLEKVINFSKNQKIDGVMTIANDVPYTVSLIANELNLPSISVESAKLFSNKVLMKKKFKENNILCPWFLPITSFDQFYEAVKDRHKSKYVLKPIDGRGARGVLIIDDKTDLNFAFKESKNFGDTGKLILEKFVYGTQLSTESFILNDVCYTPAISERNYSRANDFYPYIIEDGGTIPALISDNLKLEINNLILRGAKALGLTAGQVKGDLVIDENGNPQIIELAARLSGGWFASHQIPHSTGVNFVDIVISYSLGEKIEASKLIPKFNLGSAIRYWFPKSGKIYNVTGEYALKNIPGIIKYDFFRQIDDIQPNIRMHSDRFGYVITEGEDRKEAIDRVEKAIECISIDVR